MTVRTFVPERTSAYRRTDAGWARSVVAHVDLPSTREAPSLARESVKRQAGDELAGREREMVEVLLSELVTNAVLHSGLDAGDNVILNFAVSPERIRVEVRDNGVGFSPEGLDRPRSGPGGYGLVMIDRGASRWGASQENGTCVWFELDREASGQ